MKMIFSSRYLTMIALICAFILGSFNPLLACAACYGDTTGDKMGNAASWGIFAMVIIMFGMLSAVGAFIWHLAYRAKHPLPDYDELLGESGAQPESGISS